MRIQTYHTEVFAKFLTKLAAMPDGEGSMLDHSIILYGSNMSNSDRHNQFPLPTALVRRRLRQGEGRAASALSGSHAARERAADDARSRRRAGGQARRQQRARSRRFDACVARSPSRVAALGAASRSVLAPPFAQAAVAANPPSSPCALQELAIRAGALALIEQKADVNAAESDGTTRAALGRVSRRCRARGRLLKAGRQSRSGERVRLLAAVRSGHRRQCRGHRRSC